MIHEKYSRNDIGYLYGAEWNDHEWRLEYIRKDEMKYLTAEALENLRKRRGWETEEVGNSNDCLFVYDAYKVHVCSSCDGRGLLDTEKDEWYCPKCDE